MVIPTAVIDIGDSEKWIKFIGWHSNDPNYKARSAKDQNEIQILIETRASILNPMKPILAKSLPGFLGPK